MKSSEMNSTSLKFKGVTLIELLVLISVLITTAYLSYLAYKPQSVLFKLEKDIAQIQQIVLSMQAYQSITGLWPGGGVASDCASALRVLQTKHENDTYFLKGAKLNVFGQEYIFHCDINRKLSPLYLTMHVPLKYLYYYQRYLYQLEIPADLPENPEEFIEITTRIPTVNGVLKTYTVSAEYGVPAALESYDSVNTASLIDPGKSSAFLQVPENCKGREIVDAGFFANGFCPHTLNVSDMAQAVWSLPLTLFFRTSPLAEPMTYHGEVKIIRQVNLKSWRMETQPCDIQAHGLNCNTADADTIDGWKVTPVPEYHIAYKVEYYLHEPWINLSGDSYVYARDLPLNVFQSRTAFVSGVLNYATLNRVYHEAVNSIMSGQTGYIQSYEISDRGVNYDDMLNYKIFQNGFFGSCNGYREKNIQRPALALTDYITRIYGLVSCAVES